MELCGGRCTAKKLCSDLSHVKQNIEVFKQKTRLGLGCAGVCMKVSHNKQTNNNLRCGNRKRAARLKRPNAPSDGCKNNGVQTSNQPIGVLQQVQTDPKANTPLHGVDPNPKDSRPPNERDTQPYQVPLLYQMHPSCVIVLGS